MQLVIIAVCFLSNLLTTTHRVSKKITFFISFSLCFLSWIIYDDNLAAVAATTSSVLHTTLQRFKENDFEVVRKDGLVFLREMAAEVKNFMDFKMSAVMVSHLFYFVNNFSAMNDTQTFLCTLKINFFCILWEREVLRVTLINHSNFVTLFFDSYRLLEIWWLN